MTSSEASANLAELACQIFVQRRHGEWTPADQAELERRLSGDALFAEHYRLAEESVTALYAAADMPEMMRFREQAFAHARRSGARRWLGPRGIRNPRWWWIAGAAASFVALAIAWQLSPWGYQPGQYYTGIGEQRIIELADHSRVALDARTRVAVHYTNESRTIELLEGQAQFSVAKDPTRPFRVQAGDHTVVALGTVFTVEFTDHQFRVAMMHGRVAVVPLKPGAEAAPVMDRSLQDNGSGTNAGTVELVAGEELEIGRDGRPTLIAGADLEAATAWRKGKVVFRTERLADAVRRMNRYSHVQLEIDDPALADETVSGVFEAGDTQGFIAGVQLALPVVVSYRDADTVRLSLSPGRTPQRP